MAYQLLTFNYTYRFFCITIAMMLVNFYPLVPLDAIGGQIAPQSGDAKTASADETVFILKKPFAKGRGAVYLINLPSSISEGNSVNRTATSQLILLEDNKPLGPAHSNHHLIRQQGKGKYSHWGNVLYFSTSDNSDPNHNGREYRLILPSLIADYPRREKKFDDKFIVEHIAGDVTTHFDKVTACMKFIYDTPGNATSNSEISPHAYNSSRILQDLYLWKNGRKSTYPNINCAPRVLLLNHMLKQLDIFSRPVKFFRLRPDNLFNEHWMLSVYNKQTEEWTCYDPQYCVKYLDKKSRQKMNAFTLVKNAHVDKIIPEKLSSFNGSWDPFLHDYRYCAFMFVNDGKTQNPILFYNQYILKKHNSIVKFESSSEDFFKWAKRNMGNIRFIPIGK